MTGTSAGGATGTAVRRAAAFVDAGQPREALAVLASATSSDGETSAAHRVRALALLAVDEVEDARSAAHRAVAIDPEDATALTLLSTVLLRAGDQPGAVAAARRAVAAAPASWRTHMAVADALFLDPARRVEALRASFEAVRLGPDEPLVHRRHGDLLLAAGRDRDAQAAYRRGLELAPATTGTRHNLAVSRLRRGHDGEAALTFAGVLAVNPNDATARRNFVVAVVNPILRVRVIVGFSAVATGLLFLGGTVGSDTGRVMAVVLPTFGLLAAAFVVLRFTAETRGRTRWVLATARRAAPGWTALAVLSLGVLLASLVSVFLPPLVELVAQGVAFVGVVTGSVQTRRLMSRFPRTRMPASTTAGPTPDESSSWRNPA